MCVTHKAKMSEIGHKRRGRIVLKSSRRGSQQSDTNCSTTDNSDKDPPTLHYDQYTWASPVIKTTNGELDKLISTRNQLKKEIFGQTLEHKRSPHYPVHSTPLRSGHGSSKHHTLSVFSPAGTSQSQEHYRGALSSASSDCEEPDFLRGRDHNFRSSTAPLLHNYELPQLKLDRPRIRSPGFTGKQIHCLNVGKGNSRALSCSPVQTSSADSSPLHRPLRTQSNENVSRKKLHSSRRVQRRNQVGPHVHYSLPSHDSNVSPPQKTRTHFDSPDLDFEGTTHSQNTTLTYNQERTSDDFDASKQKGTTVPKSTASHRQRFFSTTDSLSSTLSTTLTPLLTSNLRKGGRKPEDRGCFDFDAEGQLHSCFPNRQMQVFIVTWNMQEQKLLPDSLDDLLLPLSQEKAADLFVVGTQESTPSRHEWEILLQQTLGPSYVLVQSASLGVIYLTLYLRRDLIWFCSAVQCSNFATRPGTLIKTKGGVGVSFTLFGTSFLFITAHFTAHTQKVQERNSDMLRIGANLTLCPDSSDKGSVLNKYDHVFWFGDLNYRVDATREQADQCVDTSDWMVLLLKDQLTKEILQGNVFQGFSEQPISFPPSYKFDSNTDTYDSSEKKRVPSWTDRILFKSLKGSGIAGCGYNSCASLRISDHRPVYAVFKVELEPSKQLEGVPDKIVNFDRNTYTQAQQRRRQLAEELAVQQTTSEEPDGPSSKHVTSSVCAVL